MSVEVLTILMFITLMASIALGHPLAVTLAAVATVFGLIDNGFDVSALLGLFANNAWGIFLNYTLVAIPLFIYMAQILDRSKVSEGLFDAEEMDEIKEVAYAAIESARQFAEDSPEPSVESIMEGVYAP